MPVWRLQTSIQFNTAFPRDRIVITPHFNDGGALTDPDSLCEDLATGFKTLYGTTGEIRVTAYDAQGTPPVFPQGEHIVDAGLVQGQTRPRELALCLSFYSERNMGRRRGRLYIPAALLGGTTIDTRPSSAQMQRAADLVPLLTGLGGSDVDWSVYSRADDTARPVTNWFVDNEWDVIRSRGLRGDARITGTTTEA